MGSFWVAFDERLGGFFFENFWVVPVELLGRVWKTFWVVLGDVLDGLVGELWPLLCEYAPTCALSV